MTRPTWDQYGLLIAQAVSSRGDCRRSLVGAVILDTNHVVVATGYNGQETPGTSGCLDGACPRGLLGYEEVGPGVGYEESGCRSIHGEANAIKWARLAGQEARLRGATIYITREPCQSCWNLIAGTEIGKVVSPVGTTYMNDEAFLASLDED